MNGGPKSYEVALANALEMEARAVSTWNPPKWFLPILESFLVDGKDAEQRGLEKLQEIRRAAGEQTGETITIPIKHRECK